MLTGLLIRNVNCQTLTGLTKGSVTPQTLTGLTTLSGLKKIEDKFIIDGN